MRRLPALATAMLAGCTANPSAQAGLPASIPVHGATSGHVCRTKGTERFVGQPGNGWTGAAILRASNAAVLRWAPQGVMLTMDYREDRVTVRLGPDHRVTSVSCG